LNDLFSLHLVFKQADIWLKTEGKPDRRQAEMYLKQAFQDIEGYIAYDKGFLHSLRPHKVPETAPDIIKDMSRYSEEADVGPMAGVAGAIAEYIGMRMSSRHRLVFCNNGGDIYYRSPVEESFFLSAPGSPLDNMIKICVPSAIEGKGLCTSSGIFGHSINMGRAYAVSVLTNNACLADVWATAISNRIRSHLDLEHVLKWCKETECIEGVVVLVDDYLGACGDIGLALTE
jgi:ApbE superfamily uncharacterized protein (UPF0280 family)